MRRLINYDACNNLLLKIQSSEKMDKDQVASVNSSNLDAPLKSQQSNSEKITSLERTLLRTMGPSETKETINQLHSLVPGAYSVFSHYLNPGYRI